MSEAAEEVILFHPGKQVSDPKRADLFRLDSLLGRVLGLGLGLLRLGPPRLLLWDLLLLLLLHHPLLQLLLLHRRSGSSVHLLVPLFRRHLLWDHPGCWLLHHDGTCFYFIWILNKKEWVESNGMEVLNPREGEG